LLHSAFIAEGCQQGQAHQLSSKFKKSLNLAKALMAYTTMPARVMTMGTIIRQYLYSSLLQLKHKEFCLRKQSGKAQQSGKTTTCR